MYFTKMEFPPLALAILFLINYFIFNQEFYIHAALVFLGVVIGAVFLDVVIYIYKEFKNYLKYKRETK